MISGKSGFVLLVWLLPACNLGEPEAELPREPPMVFATGAICTLTSTDTLRLNVELAETDAQRAHGLMEREELAPDAGMLFTYAEPQPPESVYWMFRTRIPLDIAYLGEDGAIRAIRQMAPCTSPDPRWCEQYPAGVPYQGALEVNQGLFAANGVTVGDRVVRAGEPGCPR